MRWLVAILVPLTLAPLVDCEAADTEGELRQVLEGWQDSLCGAERVQVRFRRYVYDRVFLTEKRASGSLLLEGPSRMRWDLQAEPLAGGKRTGSTDPLTGKRFDLHRDQTETWIWTETRVYQIDPEEKYYTRFDAPIYDGWIWDEPRAAVRDDGARSRFDSCIPWPEFWAWLIQPDADELAERFEISEPRRVGCRIWLALTPRRPEDAALFKSLYVILDADTGRLWAVKIIDPSGNTETVYVLSDVQRDPPQETDLFTPDLDGYDGAIIPAR